MAVCLLKIYQILILCKQENKTTNWKETVLF
jgi:hypothetical protein